MENCKECGPGYTIGSEGCNHKLELTTDQKLDLLLTRVETLTNALRKVAGRFPLLGIKL